MEIINRKDAKELGLKTYFTGIVCKRGNVHERSVRTGWCLCDGCRASIAQSRSVSHAKWIKKPGIKERLKKQWAEYGKKYYAEHKEQVNTRAKKWQSANIDKVRASALTHYYKNRESVLHSKRVRAKKFRDENPAKVRAYIIARRKGRKLATPAWADMTAINAIYREARALQESDGIERHVDHVIPLIHDLVCGLHVHQNLQILTASENIAKRNTFQIIE